MRIGVLTFHFVFNYGAILQAYALSHYLSELDDVECEIIDYRPRTIEISYHSDWRTFLSHPVTVFRSFIRKKVSHTDFHEFENFIRSQFKLSERIRDDIEFERALEKYDAVFVGSDQIWNPLITGYDKNYLLQNSRSNLRKFSYAASIGINQLDEEWKYSLKLLSKFERISIREKSGQRLLKEVMKDKEIQCIADPIFLFPAIKWRKLEKEVYGIGEFILFYSLNHSNVLEQKVKELSSQLGLEIISIHPLYRSRIGRSMSNIGPEQFLWLIDHARYVCTDSFHATAFSVILQKRVIVEYDMEKGNRITNLLNLLDETIEKDSGRIGFYNFQCDDYKLNALGEKGKKFIQECIGERNLI